MPRQSLHFTLIMLDETEHDFDTTTYQCTADLVAFERRFGISAAQLGDIGSAVKAVALAEDPETLNGVRDKARQLKDEWVAFFTWRCAARGVAALAEMPFDAFVDTLAEVTITVPEAVPDPTGVPSPA